MYIFVDALCSVHNELSLLVEDDLSKVEDVLVAIEDDTLWVVVVTFWIYVVTGVILDEGKSGVVFVVLLS